MAWQSNVGGGWTDDHVAHWHRGTPPQRVEAAEEQHKPDWHGKRRVERWVGGDSHEPMATLAQGRIVPLSPGRATQPAKRGACESSQPTCCRCLCVYGPADRVPCV